MKIPGNNDVANLAKNLAKSAGGVAEDVAKVAGGAAKQLDHLATSTLANLHQAADQLPNALGRAIRANGEALANGLEFAGKVGTAVIDAQIDVTAQFKNVFGEILAKRQEQAGQLKDIFFGKNSDFSKLDMIDLIKGKIDGLLPKTPFGNLQQIFDRIRDLLNGPPATLNPLPFRPLPNFPTLPGITKPGTPPAVGGPGTDVLFKMISQLIKALVEAIQAQKPGATQPAPTQPGATAPTAPSAPSTGVSGPSGGGDFKDAILAQVGTVDGEISKLRGEIASGKLTPEESQLKMIELQEQMQLKSQLINMLTSMMKAEHDMAMAIIQNLRV
jgi:hypothetical protein